jgi:hypothetical protein
MVIAWPMNARWVAGVWVRGPLGAEVGMTASGCVFWPVAVGHDLYGHIAAPVINDKAGGMRSAVRLTCPLVVIETRRHIPTKRFAASSAVWPLALSQPSRVIDITKARSNRGLQSSAFDAPVLSENHIRTY